MGLKQLLAEWREGRPYRFPLCCQAHYYWDVLRGWPSATLRGGVDFGTCNAYVPCALCRQRPWRWRLPRTLSGPLGPPRYRTWVQTCADYGISAETALRYRRRER